MESRIMDVLGDRVLEHGPAPDTSALYRHFKLSHDDDGVAWLLFDRNSASANTLSAEVIEELDAILGSLENQRPTGLVIRSAKKSGFIAGADVNEFRGASDAGAVEAAIGRAHAVIDRLEALKVPTVAVIHGFCLGGGLEVALACQSRIAIEDARFGFPEVMLGLHPGLGGTARFTHLVNPVQAMTLMLTGKTIDARKAKSLGLVDAVTQERHVRNAVKDAVFGRLKRAKPGFSNTILNSDPLRGFLASRMRREAAKAAPQEHYPAPYALIDLWERHGGDKRAMLAAEKTSFANLMVTPTAQNLIRVFFLREQMKKLAGSGNAIKHVHVIGAGAMGGDIAAWCAGQGLRVSLADMKHEPIAGAVKRAFELFGKIKRKRTEIRDALDRLIPDLDGEGVRNADLIIEAVPEKLELKQKVYASLEPKMKTGAILATNTSSIPLQDLRATLQAPARLVGLHFFNPVSRLQLVEVISHDETDPQILKSALAFVGAIDRLPLPVKSSPGF
ncbi:MAG TPA: 3-hydroxyacyl-CoA dehydrogenase NAD-binding domain-containing protein, partial [Bradyrhizobium sp.]|nr:3-hydroxyacyl-CoA dehydrogenase NAD-binding domain-containing protein [Bradyrhizobium sp.]